MNEHIYFDFFDFIDDFGVGVYDFLGFDKKDFIKFDGDIVEWIYYYLERLMFEMIYVNYCSLTFDFRS